MTSTLSTLLTGFSEKLQVPAVIGGVLSADGVLDYEVTGVRRRGSDERAEKSDAWHIGSCAKSITAALFARLVERGDADWQSPIASLFPDLAAEIDPGWKDRTVEDLHLCEAGMQANPDKAAFLAAFTDTRALTDQRSAAAVQALRTAPRPRGRFLYSNLSYMVIGAAIDRLSGMPFEAALKTHLLDPLGITSLDYGPPNRIWGHKPKVQLGSMALLRGRPADPADVRSDNPRVFSAAGTMHMTMADWAKFLGLFLADGGSLLHPDTINYLLTDSGRSGRRMAKGWARAERIGSDWYGMQGSNTLWAATALLNRQRARMGLVICNDGRTRVLSGSAGLTIRLMESHTR